MAHAQRFQQQTGGEWSTCPSQNAQNAPTSDHFCKLTCRKSAGRCGAKHMSKPKAKKNWGVQSTFGRSDVVFRGRRRGLCTLSKVSKTWGFCSSFNYNHHYTRLHSTPLHYIRLQLQLQLQLQRHYITLHYSTLITLHYAVHYTALNYPTLHSTPLNRTTTTTTATTSLHCTILHLTNYIALRYTTLRYTTLHYTPLHCTTLHSITPQ